MVCREQDMGLLRLRSRSLWGSNFVNFDVNIHIGRDGRVCSETNMHERIFFYFTYEVIINV
jgi:hypothetical protein